MAGGLVVGDDAAGLVAVMVALNLPVSVSRQPQFVCKSLSSSEFLSFFCLPSTLCQCVHCCCRSATMWETPQRACLRLPQQGLGCGVSDAAAMTPKSRRSCLHASAACGRADDCLK